MLGDVPNAPAPATAPEQDYPIELLCPICFNLLDDPVTWPAPQCEEKHNFCRHCIETMCETREVKSLCPICRAPSTVPVLDQLWTLPVDEILNERLKTEYPEHHAESMARRERKHAEYDALPRICVPVFESCEHQLAEPSRERLHRGKKVDFRISKPEHLLLLATCFANPETTRFGILLEGERWGYIAGSACLSRLTPLPFLRFRPPTSGIDDAKDTTKSLAPPTPCGSSFVVTAPHVAAAAAPTTMRTEKACAHVKSLLSCAHASCSRLTATFQPGQEAKDSQSGTCQAHHSESCAQEGSQGKRPRKQRLSRQPIGAEPCQHRPLPLPAQRTATHPSCALSS